MVIARLRDRFDRRELLGSDLADAVARILPPPAFVYTARAPLEPGAPGVVFRRRLLERVARAHRRSAWEPSTCSTGALAIGS